MQFVKVSTELISEISAPTISISFDLHLFDFLSGKGEVDVYRMCMCFIVSISSHTSPSMRHDDA